MRQALSLTVHMNEPCQENWNEMTPTQQGRFCNKCQKTVIDFTGFSDQKMLQYFLTNPFPVCGKTRQSQRDQMFTDATPKINRNLAPVAAATLLTLTAITTEAETYNTPHAVAIQQVQQSKKWTVSTPTDSVTISGTVKNSGGAPLENVEIVFGDLKLLSDKNGYFQFTLPTASNKPAVIKFSYGKLEPQVRSYHPLMGSTSYDVMLFAGYMPQGEFYGLTKPFFRLSMPDSVSTLTFRSSNKLDKNAIAFLNNLTNIMRDMPDLYLSVNSWYKTSPGKAAAIIKQVKNYLVDSAGILADRLRFPPSQPKKQLTSGVMLEFKQTEHEE